MADDWESLADDNQDVPPPAAMSFNPGASSFVPSFSAPAFVPGGGFGGAPMGGAPMGGYGQQQFQPQGGYAPPYGQQPYGGGFQQQAQPYQPQFTQARAQPAAPKATPKPPVGGGSISISTKSTPKPPAGGGSLTISSKKSEPKKAEPEKVEPKKAAPKETKEDVQKVEEKEEEPKKEEKKTEPAPVDDDDDGADLGVSKEELEKLRKLEHINIIFIGHVDAGKSTIGGHLMFLTGGVDQRTLEKYEKEAREKNRESWYLSWALDTNDEERAKGKTVECGKAAFATEKKAYSIIDAPGHKSYVPNMISGAVQADVAILVISARTGEFEAGFDRGGQTREHAMLAKSAGVKQLIIVINKMDLSNYDKKRYDECVSKLKPFLKTVGFNPAKDCVFMPISGQMGHGLTTKVPKDVCDWYDGPALVEYLDSMPKIQRNLDLPIRLPVAEKFSNMGTWVMGKINSGSMKVGDKLLLMPNKKKVIVSTILEDEEDRQYAASGDSVSIKLKGIEEDELQAGYVLCAPKSACSVCYTFDAQVAILDYKSIIAAGFQCILHVHTAIEEVTLKGFICYMNRKTGKPDKDKGRPRFTKQGEVVIARISAEVPVCLELFKENQAMGRFTLRDEGKTIAIGKVLKMISLEESKIQQDAAKARAASAASS